MATSLLDRVGFSNSRAVANAEQDVIRRRSEERIVADLVDALARGGASDDPNGHVVVDGDRDDAAGSAA